MKTKVLPNGRRMWFIDIGPETSHKKLRRLIDATRRLIKKRRK